MYFCAFPLRERGDRGGGSAHTECVGREVFSNTPPPLHLNDEREMTANFVTTCFFLGGGFV